MTVTSTKSEGNTQSKFWISLTCSPLNVFWYYILFVTDFEVYSLKCSLTLKWRVMHLAPKIFFTLVQASTLVLSTCVDNSAMELEVNLAMNMHWSKSFNSFFNNKSISFNIKSWLTMKIVVVELGLQMQYQRGRSGWSL